LLCQLFGQFTRRRQGIAAEVGRRQDAVSEHISGYVVVVQEGAACQKLHGAANKPPGAATLARSDQVARPHPPPRPSERRQPRQFGLSTRYYQVRPF
jgi:hypothetical protein